jgi:SAM-dependent methyltransferase
MRGACVRDAMWPVDDVVGENDSIADAVDRMRGSAQASLPVRRADGTLAGTLVRREAIAAVRAGNGQATVGSLARPDATVAADDDLDSGLSVLRSWAVNRLPVADAGVITGMVSQADLRAEAMLREMGSASSAIDRSISPRDKMAQRGTAAYLAYGVLAVKLIRQCLEATGAGGVRRLLDFGCGHGRVMRVLRAVYPDAELVACDVDEDAVAFCAATFGARPVVAGADPRSIELDGSFDLVWSGSVLTHLDPRSWPGVLSRLRDALAPGGLLVASVNGAAVADRLAEPARWHAGLSPAETEKLLLEFRAHGVGFRTYEGRDRYGLSLCSSQDLHRIARESGLRVACLLEGACTLTRPGQDLVALLAAGDPARG